MTKARKRGRPVRIYFKCTKGGNEKALWLDAFSVINRLSESGRRTFGLRSALANNVRFVRPYGGRVRKRISCVDDSACSLRDVGPGGEGYIGPHKLTRDESQRLLSYQGDDVTARINQMYYGIPMKKNEEKEYKVKPGYAYPHRWMTIQELHTEMMLQSTNFHDLTDPDRSSEKIGTLRVEVLQCIGLPRLDLASDTDAVIYMVCGPHAFTTDVIPDRTNPMWLRKTKRACIFPIYHGYARLFVGVFDDDGENAKDDYAGRVVVDVARLRHQSTYDVLLPLRLSAHVYSRRPRGAIRLRFTLEWKNEKDVLLSYIPKNFKITPPLQSKPDTSTTIPCADPKAFRNVAFTVHGEDLPGRFKLGKIKASIREGKQDLPPEESHNCAKMAHSKQNVSNCLYLFHFKSEVYNATRAGDHPTRVLRNQEMGQSHHVGVCVLCLDALHTKLLSDWSLDTLVYTCCFSLFEPMPFMLSSVPHGKGFWPLLGKNYSKP